MKDSSEIVLVPLEPIDEHFLASVQRALFRNFRRPILVLSGFSYGLVHGEAKSVEPYISNVLPEILELANGNPEAVVFFLNRGPRDGAMAKIVKAPEGPRLFLIPLDAFPDINSRVRGIIHSLGHGFGLKACPVPGCIMNHWSFSVQDKDQLAEPSLCLECSQAGR